MRTEWEEAHTVTEELVGGPPSRRANATLTVCPNGGHLWCIGGEFFSVDGRYFYNDLEVEKSFFSCFDITTHSWDRIDTKIRPSARSGHRMAFWKHYLVLFGGFYDPGVTTRYLNDLWLFDTQEYKWNQVEFREMDAKPSGCTMTLWAGKGMGILFGGVTDEDTNEETLYGYQLTGKGKWSSMTLKKPKAKGGAKSKGAKKKQGDKDAEWKEQNSGGEEDDEGEDEVPPPAAAPETPKTATLDGPDPTDPLLTTPLPRYNAMLAVLRNTLYIYGGIYERGSREYTLDDFTRFNWIKWTKSSSGDDGDDDGDDGDDDYDYEEIDGDNVDVEADEADEEEVVENAAESAEEEDQSTTKIELIDEEPKLSEDELRSQATAFMGVSKDSPEDIQSTPLPGETLAMFYVRSREYWTQKAHGNSDNQGKQLRRDGFTLAEERYSTLFLACKGTSYMLCHDD
ncbi:hypothetical protein BYT27DRAFT_7238510 [Phlegmacium glaucopus]|nr:hypothetical protein BYT27DRAFT_7238510 [Phlegmacium glaucopus]